MPASSWLPPPSISRTWQNEATAASTRSIAWRASPRGCRGQGQSHPENTSGPPACLPAAACGHINRERPAPKERETGTDGGKQQGALTSGGRRGLRPPSFPRIDAAERGAARALARVAVAPPLDVGPSRLAPSAATASRAPVLAQRPPSRRARTAGGEAGAERRALPGRGQERGRRCRWGGALLERDCLLAPAPAGPVSLATVRRTE